MLEGAALTRFLLEKHGRSWDDVALPGVSLADLDGRIFDEYRHRGVESQRLPPQALNESDEAVIERLRLRDGTRLKRAAVLLFHPEPHRFFIEAGVKIGAFRGAELLYQDEIGGDLFTQVDRVMDLLYTKYSRGLVSYNDIYRVETFPVPRAAMREAVVNAVIHRDYATPASTPGRHGPGSRAASCVCAFRFPSRTRPPIGRLARSETGDRAAPVQALHKKLHIGLHKRNPALPWRMRPPTRGAGSWI